MTVHRITTTDSLPILAARYYGDATRWREIATANSLRPPYISADPLDQYGLLLASYALTGPIVAGTLSFALPGADVAFVRPGALLYLKQTTPAGVSRSDAAIVASYDSASITLESALANGYASGVPLLVFAPPGELIGTVATPGDTLIIPNLAGDTAQETTADDRFLRDLACDAAGRLTLSAEGDLTIASGKANLLQQLRNRLRCERGAMPRHADYGCSAQSYIGSVGGPTLAVLLQSALALSLSDDPRVGSVEQVGVTISDDLIDVSARVLALNEAVDLSLVVGR